MRRKERLMTDEAALEIINSCDYGVLCIHDDSGYPYGVPVNYGFDGE